jgi:hypothetical protein
MACARLGTVSLTLHQAYADVSLQLLPGEGQVEGLNGGLQHRLAARDLAVGLRQLFAGQEVRRGGIGTFETLADHDRGRTLVDGRGGLADYEADARGQEHCDQKEPPPFKPD